MAKYELPIEDPTPDLSPTAAAHPRGRQARPAVATAFAPSPSRRSPAEAGENPALIRYHFGSKAGLLTALVDSVLYQEASTSSRA